MNSTLYHMEQFRNIAIIAHVDHGKTTLVDGMLKQSGTFRAHTEVAERIMDSQDLERERGITISAKNASLVYRDIRINLVDTPGHADFGGEVERALLMVDGAVLLVDAAEGCLPQTRFVLQKALERDLKMVVIINKVDRPDARIEEVEQEVMNLFMELAHKDEHIDFPILYASGREGWCSKIRNEKAEDLRNLFDTIIESIPPPKTRGVEGDLQILVANIDYNPYVGRIGVGRIERGKIKQGQELCVITPSGVVKAKAISLKAYRGLEQKEIAELEAGDIAILATGYNDITIGDTICVPSNLEALPRIKVDEPTVSVEVMVNTSPMAGREGQYLTSRKLFESLNKEALSNVAIQIESTGDSDTFRLKARGELQISIIVEKIRREGGEICVGRPKIVTKTENGQVLEPVEMVVVDVPNDYVGIVTEKISTRKGRMENMQPSSDGRTRIDFRIPSRGLLGYRSSFLTDTRGMGLMSSYVSGYEPVQADVPRRMCGALVADRGGPSTEYALHNLESRGKLFVREQEQVYEGMIVGEHNRDNDLNVNVTRAKQLTNFRSAGSDESTKLIPITKPDFEWALDWIDDDEIIEVTPKSVRLRKRVLDQNKRSISRMD